MSASTKSYAVTESPWMASVAVVVSDREASKRWYIEKLGLDLIADNDHWVTVGRKGKGGAVHLCQASDNSPPIPLEPGPSSIVFVVPGEFQAECQKLKSRGVEFTEGPVEAPWGWYANIRDPDGNEHHLSPGS